MVPALKGRRSVWKCRRVLAVAGLCTQQGSNKALERTAHATLQAGITVRSGVMPVLCYHTNPTVEGGMTWHADPGQVTNYQRSLFSTTSAYERNPLPGSLKGSLKVRLQRCLHCPAADSWRGHDYLWSRHQRLTQLELLHIICQHRQLLWP